MAKGSGASANSIDACRTADVTRTAVTAEDLRVGLRVPMTAPYLEPAIKPVEPRTTGTGTLRSITRSRKQTFAKDWSREGAHDRNGRSGVNQLATMDDRSPWKAAVEPAQRWVAAAGRPLPLTSAAPWALPPGPAPRLYHRPCSQLRSEATPAHCPGHDSIARSAQRWALVAGRSVRSQRL